MDILIRGQGSGNACEFLGFQQQLDRSAPSGDDVRAVCFGSPIGISGNEPTRSRVLFLNAVSPEDEYLISECLAGRSDAFGQLVERYQDRLYNSLSKILGSAEDARDVAQDTFVHAFLKLSTFRGNAAFYSWLFRIAINAAVSQKRKTRHVSASIDAVRERTGLEPTDQHPDSQPSRPLELSECQAQVRTALAQISEEYRTVLVLKEMEGLKYEEIAQIIDCPIGTVRSRIHRARSELRRKLQHLLIED